MTAWPRSRPISPALRPAVVAGAFYPAERAALQELVGSLLDEAGRIPVAAEGGDRLVDPLLGLLLPHAGLVYSGAVAAAGLRQVDSTSPDTALTVVLLGTNHSAGWLTGVAAWGAGAWRTPLGDVEVDAELAGAILELGAPFSLDRDAHLGEHSIEVQLPLLQVIARQARIVPLSVAAGTGEDAIDVGVRLGELLAGRRAAGQRVVLAISSDMAHYPRRQTCALVTEALLPAILALDPVALAAEEQALLAGVAPGLVCGMCGIEPAVLGLAALRALGAKRGIRLAAATSADAGGPPDRTVGYLSVAFTT